MSLYHPALFVLLTFPGASLVLPLTEDILHDLQFPSAAILSMFCLSKTCYLSNAMIRTADTPATSAAIVTPTSSECDESGTIHADTIVANASHNSSPSLKKEVKKDIKKESQ